VNEVREKLAQAVRERQVLENLKAQDFQAFQKAERKRDQAMMDELAARRKWYG
jgi:flagellar export protein FliJ